MSRPVWLLYKTPDYHWSKWHRQHPRRMWVTLCGLNVGMPDRERGELSEDERNTYGVCATCQRVAAHAGDDERD